MKFENRRFITRGVMGFPEKANRELGEKICGEMADGLVKYVNMLEEYSKQKK